MVEQWIQSDSTSFGSEPSVMTADGHKSNTEQLEIIELMREAEALFGVTPAHCTAKGLQQLDLPNGLISRFKKFFRKYMRKLCRESLKKDRPETPAGPHPVLENPARRADGRTVSDQRGRQHRGEQKGGLLH